MNQQDKKLPHFSQEAQWQVGDPRCDFCDNGVMTHWAYCPYCSHVLNFANAKDRSQAKLNDATDIIRKVRDALVEMAQQKMPSELSHEDYRNADFEGACGVFVRYASAALALTKQLDIDRAEVRWLHGVGETAGRKQYLTIPLRPPAAPPASVINVARKEL